MTAVTETIKPKMTSLSDEVNKTHKSAVRSLFHDDYQKDNTIELEGNFRGPKTAFQHKSIIQLTWHDKLLGVAMNDESMLDFKLQDNSVFRLKMRPFSILGHFDFDFYNYKTVLNDQPVNLWFNPYIQYQTNRSLDQGGLFLGLITNLNNGLFSNNTRIKLESKTNELAGEFENNWTISYNNLLFNWYYIDDLKNISKNVARKISVEYLTDNISVSAELEKHRRSNLFDWNLDTIHTGVAYQHSKDLTYGVWNTLDVQNDYESNFAAGMHYKLLNDLALKAKLDTRKDIGIFANYILTTGLQLQGTIQSSFDSKRLSSIYDDSFRFGLKLKYDS